MDLEKKIELFSLRLSADPHSRVFAPLADLLRQAGRFDDALELLDDGLGRHPEYVSALVIKGQTLLESGMLDQARSVLGQVLELDRENFVVLRLMTEDARSRQAWNEAVPLLEKLVVLDPDDQRWSGALSEARKFLASDGPSEATVSSFATMTLVDIYLAQGYRTRALDALREMAAREPGREEVQQRIREIEAMDSAPPESPVPGMPPSSGMGTGVAADRIRLKADQRSSEKKQFEEWISRIRQEGGSLP